MSSSTSRLTELLYLDNSATTRVSEEVALKMQEAMLRTWGNPSSLHTAGQEAAAGRTLYHNDRPPFPDLYCKRLRVE